MVPSTAILKKIVSLLAGYVNDQATSPHWRKQAVKTPFVPGPNLVAADITIDSDWGNNAINITGALIGGRNPITQGYLAASAVDPAMDSSSSATARTVYGFVLTAVGTGVVMASETLPAPVNINASLQYLAVPIIKFELPASAVR